MTDLPPSPTIRQAKWDEAYRGAKYLFRKGYKAQSAGGEVMLRVPASFCITLGEAVLHMANHTMPLYPLHVAVEERSLSLLATTVHAEETLREVVLRQMEALSDLELILERRFKRPVPVPKRYPPANGLLSFGG